mgnify:CR=1 FL=1
MGKGTKLLIAVAIVVFVAAVALSSTYKSGSEAKVAPNFQLTTIYGAKISLSSLKGKYVVLLEFFYIDCPACRSQIEELKQVWAEFYKENFYLISIDVNPASDSEAELREYVQEHGITWHVAMDTAGVAQKYGVMYVPKMVLIDLNGTIVEEYVGHTKASVLIEDIASLLD